MKTKKVEAATSNDNNEQELTQTDKELLRKLGYASLRASEMFDPTVMMPRRLING